VEVKICPTLHCEFIINNKTYFIDRGRKELYKEFLDNGTSDTEVLLLDIEMVRSEETELSCATSLQAHSCANYQRGVWDIVKIEPCQNVE
jgi:hypothetical protein